MSIRVATVDAEFVHADKLESGMRQGRHKEGKQVKPLSELVKKWNPDNWPEGSNPDPSVRIVMRGCADELQAWLREADKWSRSEERRDHPGEFQRIRQKLLGTTEGK